MKKNLLILSFILFNLIFLSSFANILLPKTTILAKSTTTDINSGGYSDKIKLVQNTTNFTTKHYQGVRISFVNKKTGVKIGKSVDLTDEISYKEWIKKDNLYHSPFINKLEYKKGGEFIWNAGMQFNEKKMIEEYKPYNYLYENEQLPNFMGTGQDNSKLLISYFDNEKIQHLSEKANCYDELKKNSKDLMCIIEPILYFNSMGNKYALTSIELVKFYEDLLAEDIKKGYNERNGCAYYYNYNLYSPIHHMVPLSIYTKDKSYFSLAPFRRVINTNLNLSFLEIKTFGVGFGVIEFEDEEEVEEEINVETPDYIYRTDTYVYSSVNVNVSGSVSNLNKMSRNDFVEGSVVFNIVGENINETKTFNYKIPKGESQLAYIKWKTPSTPQNIKIYVSGNNITKNVINCRIEKLEEKTPPDTHIFHVYTKNGEIIWDKDYDSNGKYIGGNTTFQQHKYGEFLKDYREININELKKDEITHLSYHEWDYIYHPEIWHYEEYCYKDDKGIERCYQDKIIDEEEYYEFFKNTYNYSVRDNKIEVKPAPKLKEACYYYKNNKLYLKSGYGFEISSAQRYSADNRERVEFQTYQVYFPEFLYKDYFRILEKNRNDFIFKENKYSTYNFREHFTPIWYPDNLDYSLLIKVRDFWTPAGELIYYTLDNSLYIDGNLFQNFTRGLVND